MQPQRAEEAFGSLHEIFPLFEIAGYRATGHVTSEFQEASPFAAPWRGSDTEPRHRIRTLGGLDSYVLHMF